MVLPAVSRMMGRGRISFTSPMFIFQNCKAKGGEVPYFQFIFLRGPFKAWGGHEKGEKHLYPPQATVVTVLWGFPPHGLGNVGGKKKITFSTFSLCCSRMFSATSDYRPACQCGLLLCDAPWPRGADAVHSGGEDEMCGLGKHVGPGSARGSWVTRLQQKASKHHPAREMEQGAVTWVTSAAGRNQHCSADIRGAMWIISC